MRHSTSQGRYSPSTILCGRCAQLSLQVLSCATGFYDLAFSPKRHRARATMRYAIRFCITLLTMETLIHVMHVVAIKDAHAWGGMTPAQLSMIGFWNLIFVWLKVLLNHVTSKLALMITSAAAPMASLPPVGTHGRGGPSREHDTLHGEQLLGARLLACMA